MEGSYAGEEKCTSSIYQTLAPICYNSAMIAERDDILDRLLDSLGDCLNEQSARKILAFRADKATRAYVEDLANRNTEGELTAEEKRRYEAYVWFGDFVALLQAKARARVAKRRKALSK
ncbi:MAG: hypothetical protein L0215_06820 [Gemmataceae bacterium]|nr:hypothetical protein [Gemmataceae bacterium]